MKVDVGHSRVVQPGGQHGQRALPAADGSATATVRAETSRCFSRYSSSGMVAGNFPGDQVVLEQELRFRRSPRAIG